MIKNWSKTTGVFAVFKKNIHNLICNLSNKNCTLKYSFIVLFGGDDGDRTRDLIVANDTLSQLSYTPINLPMEVICVRPFRFRRKPV